MKRLLLSTLLLIGVFAAKADANLEAYCVHACDTMHMDYVFGDGDQTYAMAFSGCGPSEPAPICSPSQTTIAVAYMEFEGCAVDFDIHRWESVAGDSLEVSLLAVPVNNSNIFAAYMYLRRQKVTGTIQSTAGFIDPDYDYCVDAGTSTNWEN